MRVMVIRCCWPKWSQRRRERQLVRRDGTWRLIHREAAATGAGVDSLRSIVQARLDQLSSDERRVLQVAAVLGQNWTGSLLAQVLEENVPVPDLLRQLAEREYLRRKWAVRNRATALRTASPRRWHTPACHTPPRALARTAWVASWRTSRPGAPDKVLLRQLVYHFVRGSSRDRAAQYLLHAADAGGWHAETVVDRLPTWAL